ncbi:MAG: NUDIX domain-containing protein [Chloroflexi bacterium]|nr:NUDIX domain-containing protein [Chloroflexota bacterium]
MTSDLSGFLSSRVVGAEECTEWGGLPLRIQSYLSEDLPDIQWITSVRGLVFRDCEILVVRDPRSIHLMPGGRREAGESLEETLNREVLEETGWTIGRPDLLGFMHFRHLAACPPGYRYPYPEFVQAVYCARAISLDPDARESGGYELESKFVRIESINPDELSESNRFFLARCQATCLFSGS